MRYTILFLLLLICNYAGAQTTIKRLDGSTISTADIDRSVTRLMNGAGVQGLGLAVLNNNKIVWVKSYGFKNKPANALMDTATIVYGASLSKAVFGYLVMKLVERQVIDLDRPLYLYLARPLPEYEGFGDLKKDDRWKMITARMCLSHTTGLPNVRWFDPTMAAPPYDSLGPLKIYFTPGTKYAYSGEGFKLLQFVIEQITHKNIDELATELVFQPLHMYRTGYIWHTSFGDSNVAVGHFNNGDIDLKRKRTKPVSGGSMVTTIADYARFMEQVMQRKGLSKKSYRELFGATVAIHSKTQFPPVTQETTTENDGIRLSYGLGWGVLHCPYGKAVFKEGNGESWRNYSVAFIDKGIAVVILANSENGENVFQEIIETITGDTCIPWQWEGYVPYKKE